MTPPHGTSSTQIPGEPLDFILQGGRNIGVGLYLFKENPSLSAPLAGQGELHPDQLASSPQRRVSGRVRNPV